LAEALCVKPTCCPAMPETLAGIMVSDVPLQTAAEEADVGTPSGMRKAAGSYPISAKSAAALCVFVTLAALIMSRPIWATSAYAGEAGPPNLRRSAELSKQDSNPQAFYSQHAETTTKALYSQHADTTTYDYADYYESDTAYSDETPYGGSTNGESNSNGSYEVASGNHNAGAVRAYGGMAKIAMSRVRKVNSALARMPANMSRQVRDILVHWYTKQTDLESLDPAVANATRHYQFMLQVMVQPVVRREKEKAEAIKQLMVRVLERGDKAPAAYGGELAYYVDYYAHGTYDYYGSSN